MSSQPSPQVNPERIFFTLNAFQQSYALKGAIELDLFTHIADGAKTPAEIAARCHANERGVRVRVEASPAELQYEAASI